MSLISLIIILVIVGVIMWLINQYIPMEAGIKKVLNIAVIVVVCLWLLQVFGILGNIGDVNSIRVGKI